MSHPILNEHPAKLAFAKEREQVNIDRDKAMAAQRAQAIAYDESLTRAMSEGTPMPTPPPSGAAIGNAFQARTVEVDRREREWLHGARDEIVAAADAREDEIMAAVAEHVAALEAASHELHLLRSMLGAVAHQTGTSRREGAPRSDAKDLIDISKAGRMPLRWDEPARHLLRVGD
ncbi:MAG: hypothetical protein JWN46_82 [Acidimicrobiales bacterium]|nr:hypothetical protein [Acidimicrobiales bacterium]